MTLDGCCQAVLLFDTAPSTSC